MSARSRTWCWTLNNYSPSDLERLEGLVGEDLDYLCFGKEVGAGGTPHLQGYLELPTRRTLSSLKHFIAISSIHLEIRRGKQHQAVDYCKKDGDFHEFGTPHNQGRRKDLEVIQDEIKEGATAIDIAEQHFTRWVVYRRSFQAYRELIEESLERPVPVSVILWGPTGTGKTSSVWSAHAQTDIWVWPGGQWFDGYRGQKVALFDDFRGELPLALLLRLLDRYPMRVPVKGSFTRWCPEKIFFTSNIPPSDWWPERTESLDPLWRRVTVTHFT